MRGRESGMPEVVTWEAFFDAHEIVECLSEPGRRSKCVEFGCGYGTFTLAASSMFDVERIASFDIDDVMIRTTQSRMSGIDGSKVDLARRDFVAYGTGLPDNWGDWAMIFNLLHIESPLELLDEARRVIRPGGTLAIIHWRSDIETPRGPSQAIRPSLAQCRSWAEQTGFEFHSKPRFQNNPWHWGLVMSRKATAVFEDSYQ